MRTVNLRPIRRVREGKWACGELIAHCATYDTRHPRYYIYRGECDGVMTLGRISCDEERKVMRLGREIKVTVDRRNEFMRILRMRVTPC